MIVRRKDVEELMRIHKIPEEDQADLRECLDLLESREDIPFPWTAQDFNLYKARWRASLTASNTPPKRHRDHGIQIGQLYMIRAEQEDANSDQDQRFFDFSE